MRRVVLLIGIVAALLAAVPAAAGAPPRVTVAELLAAPNAYAAPDLPEITVRGELVGDFGKRPGGEVWVQLNGDAYVDRPLLEGGLGGDNSGIGVRIPEELWPDLGEAGGYRSRGPIVVVTGAWRYHDPERGGESYLDATALYVEEPSRPLHEPVNWPVLGIGAALLAAAGAVRLRTRSRQRGR